MHIIVANAATSTTTAHYSPHCGRWVYKRLGGRTRAYASLLHLHTNQHIAELLVRGEFKYNAGWFASTHARPIEYYLINIHSVDSTPWIVVHLHRERPRTTRMYSSLGTTAGTVCLLHATHHMQLRRTRHGHSLACCPVYNDIYLISALDVRPARLYGKEQARARGHCIYARFGSKVHSRQYINITLITLLRAPGKHRASKNNVNPARARLPPCI